MDAKPLNACRQIRERAMTNTDLTDAKPRNPDASGQPFTLFGWSYRPEVAAGFTIFALCMSALAWAGGPEGTHINPLISSITAAITLLLAFALRSGKSAGTFRLSCANFLSGMAAFGIVKALYAWPQGLDGAYLRPIPTSVVAIMLLAATITANHHQPRRTPASA